MKKYKNKIISGLIIIITLVFAYWYGGDAPGLHGWENKPSNTTANFSDGSDYQNKAENHITPDEKSNTEKLSNTDNIPINPDSEPKTQTNDPKKNEILTQNNTGGNESQTPVAHDKEYSDLNTATTDGNNEKNENMTNPVPQDTPPPVEPQDAVISDKELTCILSVRCDTILKNMSWLDKNKIDIVPKDGVIFAEKTVVFYEGESVFNVLLREMKRHKIHMEFENTPIYNSSYIRGIANLYEFDCGQLSGWMYKVNGQFPNYGCSRYQLKNGDKIEWVYTCDLGVDVGGYNP